MASKPTPKKTAPKKAAPKAPVKASPKASANGKASPSDAKAIPTRQTGRKPVGPQHAGELAASAAAQMLKAAQDAGKTQTPAKGKRNHDAAPVAADPAPAVAPASSGVSPGRNAKSAEKPPRSTKPPKDQVVENIDGPGKAENLTESRAGEDVDAPDVSALPPRWQLFVHEYMVDLNGTQAAIRAGYSPLAASDRASNLLARPEVSSVVRAMLDDRIAQIKMTRERVLSEFENIADADANELSELRRVCCRHCWGEIDPDTEAPAYQFTPAEYASRKAKWDADRERKLSSKGGADIGEFPHAPGNWYDKRKPINDRCTECFGDGVQDVFLKDTRNISRRARSIYGGVKEGKDGIEIKTYSREAALQVLAKHHKIYDESTTVNVTVGTDELEKIYSDGMNGVQAGKEAVQGRGDRIRGEKDAG